MVSLVPRHEMGAKFSALDIYSLGENGGVSLFWQLNMNGTECSISSIVY